MKNALFVFTLFFINYYIYHLDIGEIMYKIKILLVCVSIILFCYCSKLDEPRQNNNFKNEPTKILNGDVVSSNDYGVVFIYSYLDKVHQFCTGTLLNNIWIITAKHCVDEAYSHRTYVNYDGYNSQALDVVEHPTYDIALIKLKYRFNINGSVTGYHMPIYNHSHESLRGLTLLCQGFGKNSMSSGLGFLRQAYLRVFNTSEYHIVYERNLLDQIQYSGDSGGPCFYFNEDDKPFLVGVNNFVEFEAGEVTKSYQLGANKFKSWVFSEIFKPMPLTKNLLLKEKNFY